MSATALAQLTIEITQGVDDPTKVAVVPIERADGVSMPEDISAIITANLERSGLFEAIPRGNMLAFPRSERDRKSTRLNSSHVAISYAVFCLQKKKRDN